MDWTRYGFGAFGAAELASILLVFVVVIIAFIAINMGNNSSLLVLALILLLLSFLFTLGMAIFVFIGTRVRYWNEYIGCNTEYKGLYSAWNSVDTYIQAVDELFCSEKCPCFFNRTTQFKFFQNITIAPYLSQWKTSNNSAYPRRFQDCDKQTVQEAYNRYLMRNSYYNHTINPKKFHKYYNNIERFFHCTGFCGTTYFNRETGTNGKIAKYLFSDVARGVPDTIGCLERMLDWLRKTLNAYGALCLILFLLQLVLFIIVILLLVDTAEEDYEKEGAREREEPVVQPVAKKVEEEEEKPEEEKKERRFIPPPEEEKSIKEPSSERSKVKTPPKSVKVNESIESEVLDNDFRTNIRQQNEKSIEFLPSNFQP